MKDKSFFKKCAKALYLMGDVAQASVYLDACAEMGTFTEAEGDAMLDEISRECADLRCVDVEEWCNRFERITNSVPATYAEVDYGERIWDDPEAMDGARFDDLNYSRYYER